ncbi:MAG TPA: DNA methyltransferase [Rubrobacteraceae bacterium]|nr:DNA methyltransferase [Rubrobacteraceae bacterium]
MGGLHELRSYGEPGAMVYLVACVELMRLMPAACVDVVFADPPYRLSGGGVTVKSGRVTSADKDEWDRSLGSFEKDHEWNVRWLREARRVLKPDGTLWVSGTHHVVFSLGFACSELLLRKEDEDGCGGNRRYQFRDALLLFYADDRPQRRHYPRRAVRALETKRPLPHARA